MGTAGNAIDATVTYVDDRTGNVVSTNWNALDPHTRNQIIGTGKIVSIVLPAGSVKMIQQMKIASKGEELVNKSVIHHSPLNKGPLPNSIAQTFRSGTYSEVITTEPTKLYRAIGENGNPAGGFWTRTKPEGPLQSVIDSALDQKWGNSATRVIEMEVPAGTKMFEGVAASQRGLVGGGNQIYFDPNINPLNRSWIK